ncbi:hypothetical protein [Nitrosomonas sp. Is37]|uniref:hypothetical protein n=1 Tax=Nitrosomonas sp. Is37 TaxID=3080535 RepID=UPI00294AE9F6|nr:hypothetical protein [Nitrosomonas sp. Is37]MDV6345698.1 hypothetical protein [Nitrosomonas sp. Is37]
MMKKLTFLMIVLMLGFLVGCAQTGPIGGVHSNEFYSGKLRATDPSNHDAVAKHYEDAANEMKAKLQTQKKLLKEYESHSYYYGRGGQDIRSHTTANIRMYENAIKENMKEAVLHRKMARDQEKQEFGLIKEEAIDSQLN